MLLSLPRDIFRAGLITDLAAKKGSNMAVNPLVHHRHHHGKRGRGDSDLWEMSTDPFDISLRSVLDDDTPARRRTRDTRAVVNTNVDWLETPEAHIFKVDLPGNQRRRGWTSCMFCYLFDSSLERDFLFQRSSQKSFKQRDQSQTYIVQPKTQ